MAEMTEAKFQLQVEEFVKQLEHYPQIGRRPFGYPKSAWMMSGGMFIFGALLQLPLLVGEEVTGKLVVFSAFGAFLLSGGFCMRVVAFASAASGAMDRWLHDKIEAIEERAGS